MLFTSNIFLLINYFSQILWLSVVASIAALLWLRHTQPDLPRPIRVNLIIPVIFIVLCVVLVLLPSIQSPANLIVGFFVTLSGVPVYYLCIKWKSKPTAIGRFSRLLEKCCQIMFNTVFVDEVEKAVWNGRINRIMNLQIVNFSIPHIYFCLRTHHEKSKYFYSHIRSSILYICANSFQGTNNYELLTVLFVAFTF